MFIDYYIYRDLERKRKATLICRAVRASVMPPAHHFVKQKFGAGVGDTVETASYFSHSRVLFDGIRVQNGWSAVAVSAYLARATDARQ